jgi:hypothetical protein
MVNTNNVGIVNPSGLAISDTGVVYYAVIWNGITGGRGFDRLDTNSGQITEYDIAGAGLASDVYYRVAITADNSRVFFNDDGFVFYVDTASNNWTGASTDPSCCYGDYQLTLSADQTHAEATGFFYDQNLNAESYYALNDRESMNISYVYGSKLSADGMLLFQPSSNGIDILDGRLGNLLHRIALPVALSSTYDALVSDGKDNVLIAITGQGDGIAIIDLTSIPQPPAFGYSRASASHSSRNEMNSHSASSRQIGTEKQPIIRRVPFVTSLSDKPIHSGKN